MSKKRDLRLWIAAIAVRIADDLDYSKHEPKSLLAELWRTFDDLARMQGECDEKAVLRNFPFLQGYPDGLKIHVVELRKAMLNSFSVILGIQYALVREVYRRISRNNVNLNFGLLKLSQNAGDHKSLEKALGHLRAIFLSIPKKKGWFDPEERDGWIGVIDIAIAEQLRKSAELDPISTFERMLNNGFAVVYKACEDRITDEVRKLARAPKLVKLGSVRDLSMVFDSVPARPIKPGADLQRKSVISLVRELSRGRRGGGLTEILEEVARFLEEPEETRDGSEKQIHARFVESVAVKRGVSKEQARKDLRRFKVRLKEDKGLQLVKEEIQGLGEVQST